jgi:small conductance mechanosensitive channel
MNFEISELEKYKDLVLELSLKFGSRVIFAVVILFVGLWLINQVVKSINTLMIKKNVDESLRPFFKSLIKTIFKIMLFISVISVVGVETTSFIAVLGTMGLAVGLALQGSLGNFAGGVLILLFKPFRVGDVIEAQGFLGTVREIQIFHTIIYTPQGQRIVIPNGNLSNGPVTNFTFEKTRRLDMIFGIGYKDDIEKAKSIIEKIVAENENILKEPAPVIGVAALADSSVNIQCNVWVEVPNFLVTRLYMNEAVKKEFDKQGVSIPFPQRDVHLYNEN